jgi:NitT/TauT family transport system permease protein
VTLRSGRLVVAPLLMGAILAEGELGVRAFRIPPLILPRPLQILGSIWTDWDRLLGHTWVTTYEIVSGFLVGAVLGIGTALLMTQFPALRNAIYPLIIASQTTPKIAIAPLLIIWFGVGIYPKILTVALLAYFPVLINTIAGIESTDEGHVNLMRSVYASEAQIYRHIRLPTAVPYVFAGLKLGVTVSVIGAIVAEWVASTRGLGYLLLFYTQYLDMVRTFAVLIVLMALGVGLFAATALIERLVSWEQRVRRAARVTTAETSL